MRVLGIDYGDSRIGVAISDVFGWTAMGLKTINVKDGYNKAVKKISDICRQNDIKTIVIGYPKNMDGSRGFRVEKTEDFIKRLSAEIQEVEIVRWDERLTSVAAEKTIRELGIKQARKGTVDKIAATFILQGYLDREYNKKNNI